MRGYDTRTKEWRRHISTLCFVWHLMSNTHKEDQRRFLKTAWEAPEPRTGIPVRFSAPLDLGSLHSFLQGCDDYLVTTLEWECDDDDDENIYFRAWFDTKDSAMLSKLMFS